MQSLIQLIQKEEQFLRMSKYSQDILIQTIFLDLTIGEQKEELKLLHDQYLLTNLCEEVHGTSVFTKVLNKLTFDNKVQIFFGNRNLQITKELDIDTTEFFLLVNSHTRYQEEFINKIGYNQIILEFNTMSRKDINKTINNLQGYISGNDHNQIIQQVIEWNSKQQKN